MKQYVLRKVKGEVRQRFVADIISTDAGMGLFYIDTPDGPELIAAIKLGVGDVIENEGAEAPAFDRVKINSSVEGGSEYVEVADLVSRYNNTRESLKWYQSRYHQKVEELHQVVALVEQYKTQIDLRDKNIRTQARMIQNLSEINKQLEDHNVIKDPSMFNRFGDTNPNQYQPPQAQVTHGDANNQGQAAQQGPGAQSRFDNLKQECEDFFRDND